MSKPLPEIKKTVVLNAPLSKVWNTVSTSEGIASWWMDNDFIPVLGHEFILHAGPYGDSPCKVTAIQPMKIIKFDWDVDWHIKFELKELPDGKTEFTLTHSGFDADKTTKFGQDHTNVREIMDGGWEKNVMRKLPETFE